MPHIILRVLAASLLLACNSYKSKLQRPSEGMVLPASIDYAFVNAKVFTPYCAECHSLAGGNKGGINLETYERVITNLSGFEESVFINQSMPPKKSGGPLGDYELQILRLWIAAGTPSSASAPPSPPVNEPELMAATWKDIYEKILVPKCIGCHSPGEKAEDYPLTDRDYVIDPANLMIVPGQPEESELYYSITRQDKRIMPPPKTGVQLSPQEIDAIRLWIFNGAKD